jgi:ADP-ribose pyrophosphatase YjhB (NUDIX family)
VSATPSVPRGNPPHPPSPVPNSHCSACGTRYPDDAGWPRRCPACGAVTYRNPLPVAVALLPVRTGGGTALVVIRRTIEPSLGTLALPGGFIDHGESWQHAVTRELAEETGIAADPAAVTLADALTDEAGGYLLLFGLLPERPAADLPPSAPTDETEGHELLPAPRELGFPLHTLAARRWFAGAYDPAPRTRTA